MYTVFSFVTSGIPLKLLLIIKYFIILNSTYDKTVFELLCLTLSPCFEYYCFTAN